MENPTTTTVVFSQPPPIHARSETMKGNQPSSSSSSVISHDSSFPPSEGTAISQRSSRVLLQHSSSSSLASSRIGKRTSESTGSFQGQSTSFQSVGVANSQQSTSSAPGDEDNDGQCILVTPTGQSPSRRRTSSRTGVDTLQATVPHTLARSNSIAVARTLPHAFPSHNLPNLTFDHVTYHKLQTAGSPTSPPRAPPRSQRSSGRSQVSIADPAGQMARQHHHHHHDTPSIYDDKETSPTSPLNGPGAPAFNPSAPLGETTGAPPLLPLYHHRSGAFDDRTASVVESSSAATGESLQQFALTYNSEGESSKVDDFLVDAKQQSSSFESSRDNSHQQHEHNNDNGTALSYCKVDDDDDDEYSPAFDVPSGSSISSSPLSNKTTVIGHNNVVVGKTVPTEVVAKSARERLLQMHKARVELFKGKQEASNTRQQQALERRQFIADHQNLRLTASWSVFALIGVIGSSFERLAFTLTARRRRRQRMGGVIIYPVVILGMRRALRRARALLLAKEHQFARPSVEHLRTDKILGLFPSNVLDSAASSLTLRYFFPNEAIIVIGCEDDEAYVLASGTADVMMGTAKVFTMQPGMVFGTIGMISGEPRSASIFARGDGCMAWIMKRAVFDAAGDSAAVTAALEVLSELRQKNIMNVYQSRLSPAALRAFPLFHSLSHETLSDVLQGSVPRVVHRGTVHAEPTSAMSTVGHLLVLKGRISISYAPHHLSAMQPICINEERFHACGDMRNVVDLPSNNSDLTKHPAVLLGAAGCHGAGNNFPVFNVTAPALLNVNPLFLPGGMLRPTPFLITAITDCDLICFSRKTLRTLDVLEAASIQQNALNVHADFFTTPKKREVAKLLLDNISSFFSDSSRTKSVLAALQASSSVETVLGSMKMEKWVYPCGAYMSFERNSEFLINVIMDGELEQQGSQPGATTTPPSVNATSVRIWPPIAEAWFASRDAVVRVTKRAVCFRIHRRDILSWFCRALPDHSDLRTAVLVLAAHASIPTDGLACVLSFSTFDLDGAVHPEDVPAAAGGMEMPVRGALTRKFSFINNDEHTISGVLRPVLQHVAGKLRQRRDRMRGSAGSNHSDGDGGEVASQPAPPSALVKPCPPSSLRIDASSPRSSNNVASSHSLKVMMFTPPPIRPTLSTTISTIGGSGSFSMDMKPSSQSNSSRSLKDRSGRFGTDGSVTSSSTSPSTAPLMRPATPATLSSTNQPRSSRPFSTASPGTVITVPSNANFIHDYNRTSTAHPHSRHGGDNSARPPTSRQHQKSTGTNCSSPSPAYDPKYDAFVDEWMALSSKHSSSNIPPPPASTQLNSNAQRPPNAQMYGNRAPSQMARGSSAQPASSRQTRSEPRNLPVQHQVSLDALRGKSNGRAGDKK